MAEFFVSFRTIKPRLNVKFTFLKELSRQLGDLFDSVARLQELHTTLLVITASIPGSVQPPSSWFSCKQTFVTRRPC